MVDRLNLFVDTNLLVSALDELEPLHKEAVEIFKLRKTHNARICISSIVLSEFIIVLKRKKYLTSNIEKLYFELINSGELFVFNIDGSQVYDATNKMLDLGLALRSSDFIIASTAVYFDTILVTFDDQFYKNFKNAYRKVFNNSKDLKTFLDKLLNN